jgi:HSP90 family molecular chaperone
VGDSVDASRNIIGQFGVGFYSSFMVGVKVDVYTKSYKPGSIGYKWSSEGYVTYFLQVTDAEKPARNIHSM